MLKLEVANVSIDFSIMQQNDDKLDEIFFFYMK